MSDRAPTSTDDEGRVPYLTSPPMSRGLSQVMFNYLPERTFDYDRGACIAKVFELMVSPAKGIDIDRLCAAIEAYLRPWDGRVVDFDVRKPHLMLFGRPTRVLFNLFPLTFQCGRCDCVKSFEREEAFVKARGVGKCPHCGAADRFEQIYHVLVHECGHMAGVFPRNCPSCKSRDRVALDLRGSQQAKDFRWFCLRCKVPVGPLQRPCPNCKPGGPSADGADVDGEASRPSNMRVIPHRANNAYYPHSITVLNLPTEQTAALRDHPQRDQILATAVIRETYDIDGIMESMQVDSDASATDVDGLLTGLSDSEQAEIRRSLERLAALRSQKKQQTVDAIVASAAKLGESGWLEVLEYLNVHTLKRVGADELRRQIDTRHPGRGVLVDRFAELARAAGFADVQLVKDFPVVTAVFGYTRVSYAPQAEVGGNVVKTQFHGFNTLMAASIDHKRKRPVFVDNAATEALMFKLSPSRVVRWLKARGHVVRPEAMSDAQMAREWLLQNMTPVDPFVTLADMPLPARDLFVLTHTLAHLVVRALTRLSGIDRTGLAEYLFPRVCSFVVYNTKAGANLGGLHTVYSEMQEELLRSLREDVLLQTCVYDPLCSAEHGSSCHACTHLPEMCCGHYNRGLSRAVLFNASSAEDGCGYWSVD